MWLLNSSIGRKLIMSISGLFLITFLLVHLVINLLLFVSPEAYAAGCHFMENPVILAIVPVLAAGFVIHILYAMLLTWQNMRARGKASYASGNKTQTEFAARNMFVLGIIVLGALVFHLTHFWAKMQLAMFIGGEGLAGPEIYQYALDVFRNPCNSIIYLIWIGALWFHLTHGFWSAFQTVGLSNHQWLKRWMCIGKIFATLICLGFASIPVAVYIGLLN